MRLLNKTSKATEHKCGNPPTYYTLVWVDALRRWRCSGCGRLVGGP